jgi:hypothetical protein
MPTSQLDFAVHMDVSCLKLHATCQVSTQVTEFP